MVGDADSPGFIGYGPRDCLPNPPRRIRTELIPSPVIEPGNGHHQPQISLLKEVEEGKSPVEIPFGNLHNQSQVGPNHLRLRELQIGFRFLQLCQEIPKSIAAIPRMFGSFLQSTNHLLDHLFAGSEGLAMILRRFRIQAVNLPHGG